MDSVDSHVAVLSDKCTVAARVFDPLLIQFDGLKQLVREEGTWRTNLGTAEKTLQEWSSTGRKQNYTAEELAWAEEENKLATTFSNYYGPYLDQANMEHELVVRTAVKRYLAPAMITQGKEGKKLAVVELSSRIGPALTFPGSSAFLEGLFVPYGEKARQLIGENTGNTKVSKDVAQASAMNLKDRLGVAYALAETSMAPTDRVLRSRRAPEAFVYGIAPEVHHQHVFSLHTPFRQHFDACVRELMYCALKEMYGV